MAKITADHTVDITGQVCPMTFVVAKAAMEELALGQVLEVVMADGEPARNVPRSFKDDGHQVLRLEKRDDGHYSLFVKKTED